MDFVLDKKSLLKTDILVIGGSGAASSAAVTAAREGMSVLMVCKGKVGRSGNAPISISNFSIDGETAYALGEKRADKSVTRDRLFEKIVKSGFYLNEQPLVHQFVEEGGERVYEFLRIAKELKKTVKFRPPAGWIVSNSTTGAVVRESVRRNPSVEILEDTVALDLLKAGDRVNGAIALNVFTGELYIVRAKAVIVASGGFQPYSFKCTSIDSSGDGLGMALRAGAKLADMEFQLFLPGVCLHPPQLKGSIYPFVWFAANLAEPKVKNSLGENIIEKIPPEILELGHNSRLWKLIHLFYWSDEICNDRGSNLGGLLMDFSGIAWLQYMKSLVKVNMLLKLLYKNRWRFRSENIRPLHELVKQGKPWEVGISSEYCMGGILINESMKTTLEGLYACGEASSGLYGAFRVESGLTEMLVQGHRAGVEASRYAKEASEAPLDSEYLSYVKSELFGKLLSNSKNSSENVYILKEKISKVADSGLGLLRSEDAINSSLKSIREMRKDELPLVALHTNSLKYNSEFLVYLQQRNISLCLEAALMSALHRKESRGTHLRRDFPQVDNANFLYRNVVSLSENEIHISRKVPDFSVLDPPRNKYKDIPHYLRKEFL